MKRLITLLFILTVSLNSGTAQEVPELQRTLLTKVTATWCPNCGGWGWGFFEDMYDDNADRALIITNHYSGDLENQTAKDFATNFNITYQPKFLVGNVNQEVLSSNMAAKRTAIKNQVDAAWAQSPVVSAGLDVTLDGNDLTVNTKTKFFQAASGEYYVGVYVIEDGVVNYQSGQGNDAVHKKVLRTSLGSSFGQMVSSGDISADAEFDHQFATTLDASWEVTQLMFATIVWKKEGATYVFENSHFTTTINAPVSTEDFKNEQLVMKVYPSLITETATLELNLSEKQENAQINLLDLSGKVVNTIFNGELPSGTQTFEIDRSMVKSGGLYLLVIQSGGKVMTEKVVFQ